MPDPHATVAWEPRGVRVWAEAPAVLDAIDRARAAVLCVDGWTALTLHDDHLQLTTDRPLLALESAAESLARAGCVVRVDGPAAVRHPACGHVCTWEEWRLLEVIACEPERGVFVPTRSCPRCGSTISAGQLEALAVVSR